MFGKKKRIKEQESIGMNEDYTDNSDIPDEMLKKNYTNTMNQPMFNPINQTMTYQPNTYQMNQQIPQMQNSQVQPQQQNQRTSIIVKTELQSNGEFIYTVVTNYQLNIGYCQLNQ